MVILIGSCSKIIGGTIGALLSGLDWKKSIIIGTLMNTRGMMELIILNIGLEIGIINSSIFTIMVIMTIFSTIITSPIINCLKSIQQIDNNNCSNNDNNNDNCSNNNDNDCSNEEKNQIMNIESDEENLINPLAIAIVVDNNDKNNSK